MKALSKIWVFLFVGLTLGSVATLAQADNSEKTDSVKVVEDLVEIKLNQPGVRQQLDELRSQTYKDLPGGYFRAPKMKALITQIFTDFQKTRYVDKELIFIPMMAGSDMINAWVSQEHAVAGLKVYYVTVTKGLMDLLSNTEVAQKELGKELAAKVEEKGELLLRAVLAHEFGHAVNGDLENIDPTRRIYQEFKADEMGTKILSDSGANPSGMIDLLDLFRNLHKSKELRHLISQMLDEHPKPRFRIASLVDLVETLGNKNNARRTLGIDIKEVPYIGESPLPRDSKMESLGRSAGAGVAKIIGADFYKSLAWENKLRLLDQYFQGTYRKVEREPVLVIVSEYEALAKNMNTPGEFERFEHSFKRFSVNIGGFVNDNDVEYQRSIKKRLRSLNKSIVNKKIALLLKVEPKGLTPETLRKWSESIDGRVLQGLIRQQITKSESLEDLTEVYKSWDRSHTFFKNIIQWGSAVSKINSDIVLVVVRRSLDITNDVGKTLTYVQNLFPLGQDGKVSYGNVIMSELMFAAMKRPDLEYSDFIERMTKPNSNLDRSYSEHIQTNQVEVLYEVMDKRRKTVSGDPFFSTFSYGSGASDPLVKSYSEESIRFLHILGSDQGLVFALNEALEDTYNPRQVIEHIAASKIDFPKDFKSLAALAVKKMTKRSGQNMNSMVREFILFSLKEGLVNDVELYSNLKNSERISWDVIRNHKNSLISSLGVFQKQFADQKYRMLKEMMQTTARIYDTSNSKSIGAGKLVEFFQLALNNIKYVAPENRPELFEMMVRENFRQSIERGGQVFAEGSVEVKTALDSVVSEGKLDPMAVTEFMRSYDSAATEIKKFLKQDPNSRPSQELMLERRKLRVMMVALSHIGAQIDQKLSRQLAKALATVSDYGGKRFSRFGAVMPFMATMIVPSQSELVDYLLDPSVENEKRIKMDIGSELGRIAAHYEGYGNLRELHKSNNNQVEAKYIYHPYEKYSAGEGRDLSYREFFSLTEKEKQALAPFEDGFLRSIDKAYKEGRTAASPAQIFDAIALVNSPWAHTLERASSSRNPIEALSYTVALSKNLTSDEQNARLLYGLLNRSLNLVQSEQQMRVYTGLLALFVEGSGFFRIDLAAMLSMSPQNMAKMGQLKYRQHYYDRLVKKIDKYNAWQGGKPDVKGITNRFFVNVIKYMIDKTTAYSGAVDRRPILVRVLTHYEIVREIVFASSSWYMKGLSSVSDILNKKYTKVLAKRGDSVGRTNRKKLFENLQKEVMWSPELDRAIGDHILKDHYDGWFLTKNSRRRHAVQLTKLIKSPSLRSKVYSKVLGRYGNVKVGILEKLNIYIELLRAYQKAKEIWTEKVLMDLRQANSVVEAWKITEAAWEEFAQVRASKKGVDRGTANGYLLELYNAKQRLDTPAGGEISEVFIEGTRHRDEFLEKHVKNSSTNYEQIKMFEQLKSYNTPTPYHGMAKAGFELLDEYLDRLSPMERAEMALYVAGFTEELPRDLYRKVKTMFEGSKSRRKALSSGGVYMSLSDVRDLFKQTHPEEKLVAFRGLLFEGITGHQAAEDLLVEKLMLSDAEMPAYLKSLLRIFMRVTNASEKSIFLSWLLANNRGRYLAGPEVVQLLVEKGGVVSAKTAQIVASHGFNLAPEYQEVLEKFKGQAQTVDKVEAMRWIKERLAPDKYEQIKSFDRELGSGSFKIGYLVTLKDGRKIVIMLPREFVIEKTAREFEISQKVLDEVQKDPELARDNLQTLKSEIERIIREEMKILNEYQFMKAHERARLNRPFIVKWIGHEAKVVVPQPIEGWSNKEVLVEEYVDSKGWGDLPAKSLFGWSKKRLARAAIAEVLNQMLSYMSPEELKKQNGRVTIDIDPHEENQLAKRGWFGLKGPMVNIDLGQSVSIRPEVVRKLVQMVGMIYVGKVDEAVELSRKYMEYSNEEEVRSFKEQLIKERAANNDPFEVLTRTFEEVEMKGISLKSDYLYFQKLFATLIGLKRHAGSDTFVLRMAQKVLFARAMAQPRLFLREVKKGVISWKKMKRVKTSKSVSAIGNCKSLFLRAQ